MDWESASVLERSSDYVPRTIHKSIRIRATSSTLNLVETVVLCRWNIIPIALNSTSLLRSSLACSTHLIQIHPLNLQFSLLHPPYAHGKLHLCTYLHLYLQSFCMIIITLTMADCWQPKRLFLNNTDLVVCMRNATVDGQPVQSRSQGKGNEN